MPAIYNPYADIDFQIGDRNRFEVLDTSTGQKIDLLATIRRMQDMLAKKVDVSQGIIHKNKIMVVNNAGDVVPTDGVVMTVAERVKLQKLDVNLQITPQEREKLRKLTDVLILKGVLTSYENLMTIHTKEVGDCYYVTSTDGDKVRYVQYVWTGDRWSVVGTYENAPEYTAADCVSIINGVLSVLYDNVSIKRNAQNQLYVSVEGDVIADSQRPVSSAAVYAALQKAILTAGDHIRIEGEVCTAHSFVPEYDDVSKVLPHERIFHYTGENTEKFHHGYFYELQLVTKPVIEELTYHIPKGTRYIDVLEDGHGVPMGRYYLVENYKYIQELKEQYERMHFSISETSDDRYITNDWSICKEGDKVYDRTNKELLTITQKMDLFEYKLSNGDDIIITGARGALTDVDAFVGENGNCVYYNQQMSSLLGTDYRIHNNECYAVISFFEYNGFELHSAKQDFDYTISVPHGEEVWDWQQLNVQPSSTPYDPTELEKRIEDLETKSHDQNTDTALASGKLKVESNKISATLPIVSSGDIQGYDTSGTMHLLSKKMDSDMLRTYTSFDVMVSDKQQGKIPQGAWCAIIE